MKPGKDHPWRGKSWRRRAVRNGNAIKTDFEVSVIMAETGCTEDAALEELMDRELDRRAYRPEFHPTMNYGDKKVFAV